MVAVVTAQPECLPDETLGDSGRRGTVGEGDGGWVGPGWSWGGQAAGWGQGGRVCPACRGGCVDRAGGSRTGLEPKPLRGSLSPRGQRMEVMIAQWAVVGGGPGRERGEIQGLLGDAPVQGNSWADLALGWEGLGRWKGPWVGAVGLARLGGVHSVLGLLGE